MKDRRCDPQHKEQHGQHHAQRHDRDAHGEQVDGRSVASRVRLPAFSDRADASPRRTVEAGSASPGLDGGPPPLRSLCRRRSTGRSLPEVLVLEGKPMCKVLQHAIRRSRAGPSSPAPSAIDVARHLLVLLLTLGCVAGALVPQLAPKTYMRWCGTMKTSADDASRGNASR